MIRTINKSNFLLWVGIMKSVRAERKEGAGYTEMVHPFVILPEEQVPEGIEHCERCELSSADSCYLG